jgi:hypothetical protein
VWGVILAAACLLLSPEAGRCGCTIGVFSPGSYPAVPDCTCQATFGCFRIVVDPAFQFLVEAGGGFNAYPGYSAPNLTSPGLGDPGTRVGESKGSFTIPATPADFAALPIGGPGLCVPPCPYTYTVGSLAEFYFPVPAWQYLFPAAPRTMLTEIQLLDLTTCNAGQVSCPPGTSSLIPPGFGNCANPVEVKAGFGFLGDPARRSLGMVRSTVPGADFAARSFFGVFVEITLPPWAGTVSGTAFPATGAVLYNDGSLASPVLIVENDPICGLPGGSNTLFYVHSPALPAVALKFKYDQPKGGGLFWWHAGQIFGQMQLAGHGVFNPCAKSTANWDAFLATTLGTPGHAQPGAPLGGMYPNTEYPWPSSTYDTTQGTNFWGQPLDALTFTNVTPISACNLSVSNLLNPISLPPVGSSAVYTNTNVVVSVAWSIDTTNYFPSQGTGTAQVLIINSNPPVNGVVTYDTELQALNLSGNSVFGQFQFRVRPTRSSTGQHTVWSAGPGYRITGSFDAYLDLSSNNGATWIQADAPVRLYLSHSPCGASIEQLYATEQGSNTVLDWANHSYSLQYSTSILPTTWVDVSGPPPVTVPSTGPTKFFRLVCH